MSKGQKRKVAVATKNEQRIEKKNNRYEWTKDKEKKQQLYVLKMNKG
jgi:hypothetical protein